MVRIPSSSMSMGSAISFIAQPAPCRNCRPRVKQRRYPSKPTSAKTRFCSFGFRTDAWSAKWFQLLQTVQGVGAKVALAVLGTLKPSELASAIAMRDKAMVARTPGVGRKLPSASSPNSRTKRRLTRTSIRRWCGFPANSTRNGRRNRGRRVSALMNSGYAQPLAAAAIAAASRNAGGSAEVSTLIRLGLKELAK